MIRSLRSLLAFGLIVLAGCAPSDGMNDTGAAGSGSTGFAGTTGNAGTTGPGTGGTGTAGTGSGVAGTTGAAGTNTRISGGRGARARPEQRARREAPEEVA